MKNKDWGRGRERGVLIERGGLINSPSLKRGGLLERGGLIEDLRYALFSNVPLLHRISQNPLPTSLKGAKNNVLC